jgi:Mu transposase, C-terminal./Integrase core domain.
MNDIQRASQPAALSIPSSPTSAFTVDDVYKAIADGLLAFDLYNDDISEAHRAYVYRDAAALEFYQRIEQGRTHDTMQQLAVSIEVGTEIEYEEHTYRVVLAGQDKVILSGESGNSELSIETLRRLYDENKLTIRASHAVATSECDFHSLSPDELNKALKRARLLEQAALTPDVLPVSKRTLQRYRKAMREVGSSAIEQHLALVPKTKNSGNRQRKIPRELLDIIGRIAKTVYNNPTNITKKTAYKQFVEACQAAGIRPCSEKTFGKEVKSLASVRAREGKRQAYQTQPIVWYLKLAEPIHGVRPFQYVHIDHTPLDILARYPTSKVALGRVWLTLAIDAESRRIVGFYLSFEPPSYRSCMMVLRDIVRHHSRMPEMLVLDNGKEFKSHSLKRICELYGCSIRYRPAGQPRHGSVMERLFGTVHSQLIHNLEGNTQLMKHVRTVTKSVRPENFIEWTLPALHGALDYFFEHIYGTEIHPAHGEAPVMYFNERMAETGVRKHRWVRYGRTFLIETCPSPDATGMRTVDAQRGVKVNHVWYWNDAFRHPSLHGKPVEVRVDPWDVRVIYVLVNGEWKQCVSKLSGRLRGYTELEIRYAFEELSQKEGVKKKDLSPERIAEWMKVLDARNFDPRLREQQAEAKRLYGRLGMAAVESVDAVSEGSSTTEEGRLTRNDGMSASKVGTVATARDCAKSNEDGFTATRNSETPEETALVVKKTVLVAPTPFEDSEEDEYELF